MCFAVNFFVLFFWLFTQLLEYVGMFFAKFEKLSAIISVSTFLSFSFFLLSFFKSQDMNVRSFVTVPQAPEILFIFLSIFSLLVRLDNFYCSTFKFSDSSLGPLYCAVEFILWGSFFFSIIMLSSSKISICFFIISSISLLKLSTFLFLSNIFIITCWSILQLLFSLCQRISTSPSSQCWRLLIVFLHSIWDFLILSVTSGFFHWNLELWILYMRLNFIWTPVLTGFFWYSSGRRGRDIILLLPGKGMSLHSLLGLHWHLVGCEAGLKLSSLSPANLHWYLSG